MSASLLETGSETGLSVKAVMARGGNSSRALAVAVGRPRASPAFLVGSALHGFAHLGSNSNNKEWRFFGGQNGLSSIIPI
jgi:hypothetical protein